MRLIVFATLFVSWIGAASAQSEAFAENQGRRRSARQRGPAVAAPIATADSFSLNQASLLTITAPGVLANDILNGALITSFGPLTGVEETTFDRAVQTAQGGSLTLSADGGFAYLPSSGFNGTETFTYVIRNAIGSSKATVTLVVRAVEASAVADSYSTAPERPLFVPAPGVLANDILAGGRIASFGARSGTEQKSLGLTSPTASGGTINLNQDGSFAYIPPPTVDDGYGYSRTFVGLDSFLYTIQRESFLSTAFVNVSVELPSAGEDFVVTSPGHFYTISGASGENPVLQLTRGKTYKFRISVSPVHPFAILDAPAGSVTNNNITDGTLTFAVPSSAQNYRYRCTTHSFGNVINTVP